MDKTEAIARFFVRAAKHYITEPVRVELIDGKAAPGGLGGCVGWKGDHWHVMMGRSVSDWKLWKSLWHEAGHVVHGDTPKVSDLWSSTDRALIAGKGGAPGAARLKGYARRWEDTDTEAQCDAWALERAHQWLPRLNEALARVKGITETTPEMRMAKAEIVGAHLAKLDYHVRTLEDLARKGNKSAARSAIYYRGEYGKLAQPTVIS